MFNDSMLKEWLLPKDVSMNNSDDRDEEEDDEDEFSDSMLQEWQQPHDQSKDDENDGSDDDGYEDSEDNGDNDSDDEKDEMKKLKDDLKAKEKDNKDLKKKLESMTLKAANEYNKRIYLEEQIERAEETIDRLLRIQELDKIKEVRKERDLEKNKMRQNQVKGGQQDFVGALAMVKRTGDTMAGDGKNELSNKMINGPKIPPTNQQMKPQMIMKQQMIIKQQTIMNQQKEMSLLSNQPVFLQMMQPMNQQMLMSQQKILSQQMQPVMTPGQILCGLPWPRTRQ